MLNYQRVKDGNLSHGNKDSGSSRADDFPWTEAAKRHSGSGRPHGSFLWVNKTTIEIWNIPTYGCIIDIYIYINMGLCGLHIYIYVL